MDNILRVPLPVTAVSAQPQAVSRDPAFNARWNEWLARGRANDLRVRRRLLIVCPLIAIVVAIAFVMFGS